MAYSSPTVIVNNLLEMCNEILYNKTSHKVLNVATFIPLMIVQLQLLETLLSAENRSSISSDTSSASLGDRIATYDKDQFLYTYRWVSRNGDFNGWNKGNEFKTWVNSPYQRLPVKNAELNCWEAAIVLLYMYHAVTKADIKGVFDQFSDSTGDQYSAERVLGLQDPSHLRRTRADEIANIAQSGDIVVFHSNRGSELGHVALVLDNFEKLWVSSHWCLPINSHMISLTPNRILNTSQEASLSRFTQSVSCLQLEIEQFKENVLSIAQQQITTPPKRIRSYDDFQELLVDVEKNHHERLSQLSDNGIYSSESAEMMPIMKQFTLLLKEISAYALKFETNPIQLTALYDILDKLDQTNCLKPCYELEYLVGDYVVISTKFRKFFEE